MIMKAEYSPSWNRSKQPRKQRKYRHNAPLHRRQKMMAAHLAKELRQQHKRRSVALRKGDEVKVMRGEHRGRYGKVEKVDLKVLRVTLDSIKARKASGQEVPVMLEPSNLLILKLELGDRKRIAGKANAAKGEPKMAKQKEVS